MTDRRLPAHERRSQLLDVAIEVFAAARFHGASMNQVAEAAGVTKPVLYQHFPSKRELFREVLEDVGSRLEEAIIKAAAEAELAPPEGRARASAPTSLGGDRASGLHRAVRRGTRADDDFAATAMRVEATIGRHHRPSSSTCDGLGDDERRVLAHGVVGIAEVTSRHGSTDDLDLDPDDARRAGRRARLGGAPRRPPRALTFAPSARGASRPVRMRVRRAGTMGAMTASRRSPRRRRRVLGGVPRRRARSSPPSSATTASTTGSTTSRAEAAQRRPRHLAALRDRASGDPTPPPRRHRPRHPGLLAQELAKRSTPSTCGWSSWPRTRCRASTSTC